MCPRTVTRPNDSVDFYHSRFAVYKAFTVLVARLFPTMRSKVYGWAWLARRSQLPRLVDERFRSGSTVFSDAPATAVSWFVVAP